MLNDPRAATASREDQVQDQDHDHDEQIRDIHALSPPHPPPSAPPPTSRPHRRENWETSSHRSSSLSMASEGASSENFTSMSREFSALVLAGNRGSFVGSNNGIDNENGNNNLARIGEEGEVLEETNPLAIVPDNNPLPSPRRNTTGGGAVVGSGGNHSEVSVHRVKREEVETKISAWQTAKVAKINNRFKREDAIIGGWESAQVQKATSWMKKVERKLEEKRARALEKMQNEVAKAHRKAEEKRASAEAKRGTKVAKVLEITNLMKAVGRAPSKRSFF
ncbi:remorin 4.1-like isoform X1 [Actinidia eriantha]|uniref:remorin 4.1-like isoform X1 n=1 Tax=Actinidia eriantha TaxID=165200 RepID=UPI002590023A|nr:remorin 4.1-like isoform X1 [Actinidia eriantha]